MVSRHDNKREGYIDDALDEQSKKTAKEDLEHKMEIALREDKMMDLDNNDDEFMDALDIDEDGKDDVDDVSLEHNKEE